MATSRTQFIIGSLATILATESSFSVQRVSKPSNDPNRKTLYPFTIVTNYYDNYENNKRTSGGITICGVNVDAMTVADPNGEGLSTELAGILVRDIEKVFYDYNIESLGTNNDGVFYTTITAIGISEHDGHFDNGDGKVKLGIRISVHFEQNRIT